MINLIAWLTPAEVKKIHATAPDDYVSNWRDENDSRAADRKILAGVKFYVGSMDQRIFVGVIQGSEAEAMPSDEDLFFDADDGWQPLS